MTIAIARDNEWLEADGRGGFASGTTSGIRTRRYHALLLTASKPPGGRFVLVNGCEATAISSAGRHPLTSQHYLPDVVHPDGATRIVSFTATPWPTWRFRLEDGSEIEHQAFAVHDAPLVVLSWRRLAGKSEMSLEVRPLLSGRDPHQLHHQNPAFRFEPERSADGSLTFQPYDGVPGVRLAASGAWEQDPVWYRDFLYAEERARGLDHVEDLASPGRIRFDLAAGEALCLLASDGIDQARLAAGTSLAALVERLRAAELARRRSFASPLDLAADAYLVRRGAGKTVIAGYPWFGDWGRDTFIALRGLALATGRLDVARDILIEWAGAVSEGMLPNRFPDHGEVPEYNAVDASLWYVVVVAELREAMARAGEKLGPAEDRALGHAVEAILEGYARGTRFGIGLDDDGLLAAGEPRVQLTWMDARVGDRVVTPRSGKPVEIQCLWINALHTVAPTSKRWRQALERAQQAFADRFWNETDGALFDVVDVDHRPGTADPSFRPNQVFAIGGLPLVLLDVKRARQVVDAVEARLWTPLGLRSLAPDDARYCPRYRGGVAERDGAYHQGTVWPWLIGPFIEAWVRVRGGTGKARREARTRFLEPLLRHLDQAGIGHICEVADGDPPHTPGGCPFQAWSVGEVLRISAGVLAE